MTIRLKIIILLLCSIVTIAVGISVVTNITASRFSKEQFALNAGSQLNRVEELVDSFLRTGEQVSRSLSQMPEMQLPAGALPNYSQTTEPTLLDAANFNPQELAVFEKLDNARLLMPAVEMALFGMEDGGYAQSPTGSLRKGYDPRARPWYKDTIASGQDIAITDPYISSSTNTLVTTVSALTKDNRGKIIGVAGIDFIIGDLTQSLQDVTIGRTGYLLLFDRQGRVMLDPKNLGNVMKTGAETGEAGLAELALKPSALHTITRGGVELAALSRELGKTGWKAVMLMEVDEVEGMGSSLVTKIAMVAAGLGLALLLIGVLTSRGITRPLQILMGEVNLVADGRFEALKQQVGKSSGPEIDLLRGNLSRMVTQIQGLIVSSNAKAAEAETQSKKASLALEEAEKAKREGEIATRQARLDAAEALESIVGQATDSAHVLEAQIRHASSGAKSQLSSADRAMEIVRNMNESVEAVAHDAKVTEDKAISTREKAEEGRKIVHNVVSSIELVDRGARALTGNLDALGKQAEGIGKIMVVITDIADQTNLLALNAAIEAARAGDAGRGFAVVADEVRKLAEKTMEATKEVGSAVKAIQNGTRESIESMGQSSEAVAQCTALAQQAGESLQDILQVAESTAKQVRDIAKGSEHQAEASNALNGNTEEVGSIARSTAAKMQEAESAVAEISLLVREIQKIVDTLKR